MRKWQFEDLCEKKRYDSQSPNGRLHKKPLANGGTGKECGTNSSTRFPRASYFEKTRNVCQKYGGACTTWYSKYERYKIGMRNQIPAQPRKVQRN